MHIARVGAHGNISAEKVKAFSEPENLIRAAKDLEPIRPTCIAWACTSGSFLVGREGSRRQIAALAKSTGTIGTASPETIYSLARRVAVDRAEAVFLSCTGLDAIDLIEDMERDLGRPVLTANQVTMWNALRLAGVSTRGLERFGALYAETAAKEFAGAASHH